MPRQMKIYHIFHASQLKPYHKDEMAVERGQSSHSWIFITPSAIDKKIEAIIDHQLVRGNGWGDLRAQFLVHWKGQSSDEASWEK